jgi:hypothetical protein
MEPWLDCFEIFAELLIYALITLWHNLIWIINKAAANTRHPRSHTSTAFTPPDHAFSITGNLFSGIV